MVDGVLNDVMSLDEFYCHIQFLIQLTIFENAKFRERLCQIFTKFPTLVDMRTGEKNGLLKNFQISLQPQA